jgi:hypothetical protein
MKTRNFLMTGLIALLLTGCFVKSLHPFYKEGDIIFKKELIGTWTDKDSSVWKIEQGTRSPGLLKPAQPDNSYLLTLTEKKGTSVFRVTMFQLGGKQFLDFYPEEVECANDMMASHLVPMHTVARVELNGGKLVIRWYNEEWLMELFRQNKIRIAHEKIPVDPGSTNGDFQVVLTAPTDELQKFMLKYSDDPEAFKNDFTFVLSKTNR